jgi:hypothetical protein
MPDFRDNVRCFTGFQGGGRVSPKAYGGVGDGVADDTAAVRAAHDYCVSIGRGDVILDGAFRITDTLTWNSAVSMVGVGVSTLYMDHPTKDILRITGSITTPTRFENFYIAAAQPNTGIVFRCDLGSGEQHILIRNVMTNLNPDVGFVRGTIVYAALPNQTVTIQNCILNPAAPTLPSCTATGGANLVISDSSFSPPGVSTWMVIEVRTGCSARITNCSLVGRPGGAGGVFVYTNAGGTTLMSNCSLKGDAGTGTVWFGLDWEAGATVITNNNSYGVNTYPIKFSVPPPTLTNRKSRIDLLPSFRITGLGTVYNAPSGYEFLELQASGTSFQVNLPGMLFMNQRLVVSIKNTNVSSTWTPVFSGSGVPSNMAALGPLAGNVQGYGIYEFVVSDVFSGTPSWLMVNNGQ